MERQQLKWFTYATVVPMVVWVVVFASNLQFQLPAVIRDVLGGIWLGGIPVGIGVAVLRYRLYDAVAAVIQPARRRIQQLVDRRFNRRGCDAARTMEAFTVRLRDHVDLEILSSELLAVVDQTMEPTTASFWLRPTDAVLAGPVLPRHPEARSSRRPMTA